MSFNIQVRKKQLQSLDQYITSSKDKVDHIISYLGWNPKKILEVGDRLQCPLNSGHKVQAEKIDKHVEKCSLRTAGYRLEDNFLSEPQHNPKSSITLDNSKKIEVLNEARCLNPTFKPGWNGLDPDPMTSERLLSTFSTDERLALYSYCIQNTEGPPEPSEFNLNLNDLEKKEGGKILGEEELRQKERNAKRRRIKYKSVHTGRNKNHTEVMRQVIDNQMEMYRDYLLNKEKLEAEQNVDEQFDQADASNLVYDFDTEAVSYPVVSVENGVPASNLEGYNVANLENDLTNTIDDNTNYNYQDYIQNILNQPQNEYDKKIKEYSEKVNQLRILKEKDRRHDYHHEHRPSKYARSSSYRDKDRRYSSHRDYKNGHERRHSRERRESHHRAERRH